MFISEAASFVEQVMDSPYVSALQPGQSGQHLASSGLRGGGLGAAAAPRGPSMCNYSHSQRGGNPRAAALTSPNLIVPKGMSRRGEEGGNKAFTLLTFLF